MLDTRERILDAAEALFAEHGIAATSVRAITAEAAVNLASLYYHFGSKEKLVEAVFSRRLRPINEERLRLLDACEREAGPGSLLVEEILESFLGPPLRMGPVGGSGSNFTRLMGRAHNEPNEQVTEIIVDQFREIAHRFGRALSRALPHLPMDELLWRFHFTVGAMAHTLIGSHYLRRLSGGMCDPSDVETTLLYLVRYAAAALRAESSLGDLHPLEGASKR